MTRRTKHSFIILLAVVLCLAMCPVHSLAADDGQAIWMDAVSKGTSIVIRVSGVNLDDLYAYQFNLDYDPEQVQFVEGRSELSGFTVEPKDSGGSILFAHTKIGQAAGTNGDALLATLKFERLTAKDAEFRLYAAKLVDTELDLTELPQEVQLVDVLVIPFTDVAAHWALLSIIRAADQGWVNGYPDQAFRPNQPVTRVEFTAMLVRAMKLDIPSQPRLGFADESTIPNWARGYVAAAVQAGLIQGFPDGTFQPNRLITRAEMAAIIVRSQRIVPDANAAPKFADADSIPAWARGYIAAAAERGWVKGVGNNRFAPNSSTSRAEAVHLILTVIPQEEDA